MGYEQWQVHQAVASAPSFPSTNPKESEADKEKEAAKCLILVLPTKALP